MKYKLGILIFVVVLLVGCSSTENTTGITQKSTSPTVDQILEEKTDSSKEDEKDVEEKAVPQEKTKSKETTEVPADSIDIDLTTMSANMVYAQVLVMMTEPHLYEGKTVKVRGNYMTHYDNHNEDRYHTIFIPDAAGCCIQGIEFWMADLVYPQDYPEANEEFEIVGVFESFENYGVTFYRINAQTLSL